MKKLLFILLLTVIGFVSRTMGQETCITSIDLPTNNDTIFLVNSNYIWIKFTPSNDTCIINLGKFNNNLVKIDSIYTYTGYCNSLTLIESLTINDSINKLFFTNLNIGLSYYLKVKLNTVYIGNFTSSITYLAPPNSCWDYCNLVKNGQFECSAFDYYQNNNWNKGWGSPNIIGLSGVPGNSAYMWSGTIITTPGSTPIVKGEGIYQNVSLQVGYEYELSFWYNNLGNQDYPNQSVSTDLYAFLADFTPSTANFYGGDVIPVFNSQSQLLSHIVAPSNNTWYNSGTINIPAGSIIPAINKLTFYPLSLLNQNTQFILIDNVKLVPKIKFNLPSPYVIQLCPGVQNANPITVTASLPSNITGVVYEWFDNLGNPMLPNSASKIILPTVSTFYTVKATDSHGCVYTEIFYVTVNNYPPLVKPIISGNPNNCSSYTGYSIANPQTNVIYTWTITPSSAGSITGQGLSNITVDWSLFTDCNITLTVNATYPNCPDEKSTILNIYPCCPISNANVLQFNNITNLQTSYTNVDIYVNGDLYITGNSVTFNNCKVYLSPYSKVIVVPGANLTLSNGTIFNSNKCCEIMWDGIYISSSTSTLNVTSPYFVSPNTTTIKNSINGIVANNNSNLFINFAYFSDNLSCITIKNYQPLLSNLFIKKNNLVGGALKSPYLGSFSRYGIKAENADNIVIGDELGFDGNYFDNLFCGIYGLNSYLRIYGNIFTNIVDNPINPYQCQSLTNPLLVCKPTAIHSAHTFTNAQTIINAPKVVEIGPFNTFDNCINGIKVYNEKAIILRNLVRTVSNAIDVLDPLNNTEIKDNEVYNCSNGTFPYKGIQVWKTQPGFINLKVYSNWVKSRYTGVFVGNCKSQRQSDLKRFFVDINENTVKLTNDALRAIVVQNCPSVFVKCNFIDKNTSTALTGMKHGISVEQTQNAEIQQNHVKNMGAGINVYGCSDLTQFYCNTLESDFYGFLFNQHASITNQGTVNIKPDNQWTPTGNYSGIYQGQLVERKLWALNHNLNPNGVNWYYDNTASVNYNPENNTLANPTDLFIFSLSTLLNSSNVCNLSCPTSSVKEMTLEEREEKFGDIVRDELEYPDLNEQFREYNRYVLYQTLKDNPWIITMGGADDYMYQDFFNNESNGNIGRFDAMETLIAEGNIDQALVENGLIIDSTLIAYNQRVVNDIYLNTFARDSYELTPAQYQTLYDIATNYTPWEGGEGVYIARYMLGIDIDYSNPNVQFSKGYGGIAEAEMLSVFPNPASNSITLSFANAIEGGFVIDVYNHTGAKVLNETVSQTEAQHQLYTTKLKNGIYFISVRTNTETFKSKFIIIK